jgi:hypothetical protein
VKALQQTRREFQIKLCTIVPANVVVRRQPRQQAQTMLPYALQRRWRPAFAVRHEYLSLRIRNLGVQMIENSAAAVISDVAPSIARPYNGTPPSPVITIPNKICFKSWRLSLASSAKSMGQAIRN